MNTKQFGTLPDGRAVTLYTLQSKGGLTAEIIDYGCRLVSLSAPDKNGKLGDVIQGHCTLEEYYGNNYQGTFVGRYANRIGGAEFTLNGKTYPLSKNDGANTLHGGPGGYHQVLWTVAETTDGDEPSIFFTHTSPDGDEGYPGNLELTVRYTLTADNRIVMEYTGLSDAETPFNPTNHSFFNLSGDYQKDILSTTLQISASHSTEVTDDLIPTGKLLPTAGTPLDFTTSKPLGKDMFADDHLISLCGGFDHNFCLDGAGFRKVCEACEPDSGRKMEVFTDMPGVQLYTFNKVEGLIAKNGKPMLPHTAFCLETQFYPDSVHHENFPFAYLQPGEKFTTRTEYKFSVC